MSEARTSKHMDVCPYWLAGMLDNPVRRLIHNPAEILSGLVGEGQTALDLGCGPGTFTLPMARMVGAAGRVIAVDLQPQMLARLRAKAERQGLLPRILLHQSSPDRIGLDLEADFALAFYMVHEVRSPESFLREVYGMLKPGGRFLVVEPRHHVPASSFNRTAEIVNSLGFETVSERKVRLSRALLFGKPQKE